MNRNRLIIGVAALARPTFDVPYAKEMVADAWKTLQSLDVDLIGSSELLFDDPALESALTKLKNQKLDLLIVLQVTFTDSTMTVKLAKNINAPVLLWSLPESRSGGRLRLNSVCGINLAAHALAREGFYFAFLHREPNDADAARTIMETAQAGSVKRRLAEARIGLIGHHPDGFDTCTYNTETLTQLYNVSVDFIEISELFKRAEAVSDSETDSVYVRFQSELGNLDELEQTPLRKSLKIYSALRDLAAERGYSGMAVRCWPEVFTDFGCAACGPMAMLNEEKIPCACEADVYGSITSLILQWLNNAPVFMTDMVDFNPADDSAVFWHCGLAPISMADENGPRRGTIHSNRKLPLLNEFALKPGRITIARLSQSKNESRLIIGGAEILRAPMSFSGTSGVVRFDKPVDKVLDTIIYEGLEHHVSMAYGDSRPALRKLANLLDIQVLEIT